MFNVYQKELRNNLSEEKIDVKHIKKKKIAEYIGGSGYGTKVLFDETNAGTKPFDGKNVLIFAVGLLTGSKNFNSNRFQVITKSPLTYIFCESNCAGKLGEVFKNCGFDASVLAGTSNNTVYICIDYTGSDIKNADYLWEKDTCETSEILKDQYGKDFEIVCIGPEGEKLVNISAIMTDGEHGRAEGRCGVGAVMGAKNVKAIVFQKGTATEIAESEFLKELMRDISQIFSTGVVPQVRNYDISGGAVFYEDYYEFRDWDMDTRIPDERKLIELNI